MVRRALCVPLGAVLIVDLPLTVVHAREVVARRRQRAGSGRGPADGGGRAWARIEEAARTTRMIDGPRPGPTAVPPRAPVVAARTSAPDETCCRSVPSFPHPRPTLHFPALRPRSERKPCRRTRPRRFYVRLLPLVRVRHPARRDARQDYESARPIAMHRRCHRLHHVLAEHLAASISALYRIARLRPH